MSAYREYELSVVNPVLHLQAPAAAKLEESAAALTTAATAATRLAELARLHPASGRIGKPDLN